MLNELLEMMAQSQSGASGQAGSGGEDALGGLLQGLLGGGGQAGSGGGAAMGGLLEALMGGMGGGQQGAPAAGMGGLLEAVMGGMGGGQPGAAGAMGGNPLLAPFTEALAEKLGISQQMASVIMSAAFMMLMNTLQKSASRGVEQPSQSELDEMMDADYLVASGMASKVAEQTGMDEAEAAESLHEALAMLSGGTEEIEQAAPPAAKEPTELDSLLDSWEVD